MNNYRKYISLIVLCVISTTLSAQRIGIEAGGALTGLQQATRAKNGDFNLLTGALGGPVVECKLGSKFGLLTGAMFEFRAGRYDIGWYKTGTTYTRELFYGQVPIHLTYRKAINPKNNWMFFGGPRINVGIFGTTNEHYYLASTTQINDSSCFAGKNALHRMDIGFDLGLGLELQRFQFKLTYCFPITNSANSSDLNMLKQHQLQLTVGYTLKKFKKKETSAPSAPISTPAAIKE